MERAIRFDLIAHAAPAAREADRFGVQASAEARSLARMAAAAGRLPTAAHTVRSPSIAAAETVAALHRDAPADVALGDRAYGAWTGQTVAAIAAAEGDLFARWLHDPDAAPEGGESVRQLIDRAEAWLERGVEQGRSILAVTHPAVIRACLVAALSCPPEVWFRIDIAYATRSILTRNGAKWRVSLVGGTL